MNKLLFWVVCALIAVFAIPLVYSQLTRQDHGYPREYICPTVPGGGGSPFGRAVCFNVPRVDDSIGTLDRGVAGCVFGTGDPTDSFPGGFDVRDFAHGVNNVSQFNDTRGWGNNSCAPAAAAAIIEFLNRTSNPGIMDNFTSIPDLVDEMRNRMRTNENGTLDIDALLALIRYIVDNGFDGNVTMSWYNHNITLNNRPINETRVAHINDLNVTLYPFDPNYTNYNTELFVNHELVILAFEQGDIGHVVVGDDINNRPNDNRRFNVSFMDPGTETGNITSTEMGEDGVVTLADGTTANLTSIITISPV